MTMSRFPASLWSFAPMPTPNSLAHRWGLLGGANHLIVPSQECPIFFLYMHSLVQVKSPCLLLCRTFSFWDPASGSGFRMHRSPDWEDITGTGARPGIQNPSAAPQRHFSDLTAEGQSSKKFYTQRFNLRILLITLKCWNGSLLSSEMHTPIPRLPLPFLATSKVVAEQHLPLPEVCGGQSHNGPQHPHPHPYVFFFFFLASSPNTCSIN